MNYFVEEEPEKGNKVVVGVIVGIIISVIAIMVLLYLLMTTASNKFGVYIDEKAISITSDMFIIQENGKIYVSISDMAEKLNYEFHVGEYKQDEQDTNKCYIEPKDSKSETASFFLNSNKISKIALNSQEDYEIHEISEPVKKINNKMYVISDGFEKGFNVKLSYNNESNRVNIYTIEYIIQNATKNINDKGYEVKMDEFNNSKVVLYGMYIVKNINGKVGVIDSKMNEIVAPKYNKIEFIENTQEFFVTNAQNKVGILLTSGAQKITPQYDDIKVLDREDGLYVIKQGNRYGVISNEGATVIHTEYDAIGIDSTKFPNDLIENKYMLFDNAIPVKSLDKWGLFDKDGNKILDVQYKELGCTNSTVRDKVTNNVLIIPRYEAIVVCKDELYGLVDSTGKELIPCALTSVYTTITSGIEDYYMIYNGNVMDVIEYLDTYVKKSNTTTQNNSESKDINVSNTLTLEKEQNLNRGDENLAQ